MGSNYADSTIKGNRECRGTAFSFRSMKKASAPDASPASALVGLAKAVLSSPFFLKNHPDVERLDEISDLERLQHEDVIAYYTGEVFHMAIFLRSPGERPCVLHNFPGRNVTYDPIENLGLPTTVMRIVYRQSALREGHEERRKECEARWVYDMAACNCEHFVSYYKTGTAVSYSRDRATTLLNSAVTGFMWLMQRFANNTA